MNPIESGDGVVEQRDAGDGGENVEAAQQPLAPQPIVAAAQPNDVAEETRRLRLENIMRRDMEAANEILARSVAISSVLNNQETAATDSSVAAANPEAPSSSGERNLPSSSQQELAGQVELVNCDLRQLIEERRQSRNEPVLESIRVDNNQLSFVDDDGNITNVAIHQPDSPRINWADEPMEEDDEVLNDAELASEQAVVELEVLTTRETVVNTNNRQPATSRHPPPQFEPLEVFVRRTSHDDSSSRRQPPEGGVRVVREVEAARLPGTLPVEGQWPAEAMEWDEWGTQARNSTPTDTRNPASLRGVPDLYVQELREAQRERERQAALNNNKRKKYNPRRQPTFEDMESGPVQRPPVRPGRNNVADPPPQNLQRGFDNAVPANNIRPPPYLQGAIPRTNRVANGNELQGRAGGRMAERLGDRPGVVVLNNRGGERQNQRVGGVNNRVGERPNQRVGGVNHRAEERPSQRVGGVNNREERPNQRVGEVNNRVEARGEHLGAPRGGRKGERRRGQNTSHNSSRSGEERNSNQPRGNEEETPVIPPPRPAAERVYRSQREIERERAELQRLHELDPQNYRVRGALFGNLRLVRQNHAIDPPPGACFNCWQPSHTRYYCPRPQTQFCYNCGRREEDLTTCPRCSEEHWRWRDEKESRDRAIERAKAAGKTVASDVHRVSHQHQEPGSNAHSRAGPSRQTNRAEERRAERSPPRRHDSPRRHGRHESNRRRRSPSEERERRRRERSGERSERREREHHRRRRISESSSDSSSNDGHRRNGVLDEIYRVQRAARDASPATRARLLRLAARHLERRHRSPRRR